MKIREAEVSDLPFINAFLFYMNLTPLNLIAFGEKYRKIYVLDYQNIVIGCIIYVLLLEEAELEFIYVEKEHRYLGYATSLLQFMKADCHKNKCQKVFLEVNENNLGAIKLYKLNQFQMINKRKGYYGKDDAIIMCLELW